MLAVFSSVRISALMYLLDLRRLFRLRTHISIEFLHGSESRHGATKFVGEVVSEWQEVPNDAAFRACVGTMQRDQGKMSTCSFVILASNHTNFEVRLDSFFLVHNSSG